MLRQTASSLRIPNASRSILSSHPSASSATSSRFFVSTVLLTRYEKVNVSQLKATLRERGLSTSGKKEDLIKRLLSDDTKRAGSDASNPIASTSNGKFDQINTFSTSSPKPKAQPAAAPAPAQASKDSSSTLPDSVLNQGVVATSTQAIRSADSAVESIEVLEAEPNPPGLPPAKIPQAGEVFNIQIPYYPPDPVPSTPIPLVTSYINFKPTDESKEETISVLPKVMTVSDPSTYHGGGVLHAGESSKPSTDSPSSSSNSDSSSSPSIISQILNDASSSLGVSSKETETFISKTQELTSKSSESLKGALKEAGIEIPKSSSSSSSSSSSDSSSRDRPLNEEETRGLYVLGGIVVGGFVLGGFGKPSKKKDHSESHGNSHSTSSTKDSVTTAPGNKLSGGKGSSGRAVIEAKAVGSDSAGPSNQTSNSNFSQGGLGAGMVGGAQRKV